MMLRRRDRVAEGCVEGGRWEGKRVIAPQVGSLTLQGMVVGSLAWNVSSDLLRSAMGPPPRPKEWGWRR